MEAGAKATWVKSIDNAVHVEVGTKYILDNDAFLKVKVGIEENMLILLSDYTFFQQAKIDNNGQLGLGYTQLLRRGIKLSLGGLFDTTRLHENVHKVGLSLTLEA